MNYYQHHIGDFNNATRHLSLVERAIYRDLLDMYYDTEQAIDASNLDRLARRLQCSTDEQVVALKYVLEEFFKLDDGLYINNRCEREIAEFHSKRKQASEAGKASAKKRAAKKQQGDGGGSSNDNQQVNESLTTVEDQLNENSSDEQLTINHKPLTSNQSYSGSSNPRDGDESKSEAPIQFATYQAQDHKRYTLLECVNEYPLQNDFIDLAQKRFKSIDRQDLVILFKGYGDWFVASDATAPCTPSIWLVKWFTWIQNNKDQVQRNREKQSAPKQKTKMGQSQEPGYFAQLFSEQSNSQVIDVTPEVQFIEGVGHA